MTFALIYHDVAALGEIEAVGFPGPQAARYKLRPERLERHLQAISNLGLSVGLVNGAQPGPGCAITFDDGGASALMAADMLERFGWRGHFFITTGRIDTPGFLTAVEVRELADRGHAVGSHSHSHPTYMGKLTGASIAQEWSHSRELLGELLGAPPSAASVPGGFLSRAVVEQAGAAGYRLLMTSQPTTKVLRLGELTVLGRYAIRSNTAVGRAVGYARGSVRSRARLWVEWQAKAVPKRLSPEAYQVVARARARVG